LTNGGGFSIIAKHLAGRTLFEGRGRKGIVKTRKTFLRNFKKRLDKRGTEWYNKRVASAEGNRSEAAKIGL
jgi:hypothetical protein